MAKAKTITNKITLTDKTTANQNFELINTGILKIDDFFEITNTYELKLTPKFKNDLRTAGLTLSKTNFKVDHISVSKNGDKNTIGRQFTITFKDGAKSLSISVDAKSITVGSISIPLTKDVQIGKNFIIESLEKTTSTTKVIDELGLDCEKQNKDDDFPHELISLYAKNMTGNTTEKIGEYTICKLSLAKSDFVFIRDNANNVAAYTNHKIYSITDKPILESKDGLLRLSYNVGSKAFSINFTTNDVNGIIKYLEEIKKVFPEIKCMEGTTEMEISTQELIDNPAKYSGYIVGDDNGVLKFKANQNAFAMAAPAKTATVTPPARDEDDIIKDIVDILTVINKNKNEVSVTNIEKLTALCNELVQTDITDAEIDTALTLGLPNIADDKIRNLLKAEVAKTDKTLRVVSLTASLADIFTHVDPTIDLTPIVTTINLNALLSKLKDDPQVKYNEIEAKIKQAENDFNAIYNLKTTDVDKYYESLAANGGSLFANIDKILDEAYEFETYLKAMYKNIDNLLSATTDPKEQALLTSEKTKYSALISGINGLLNSNINNRRIIAPAVEMREDHAAVTNKTVDPEVYANGLESMYTAHIATVSGLPDAARKFNNTAYVATGGTLDCSAYDSKTPTEIKAVLDSLNDQINTATTNRAALEAEWTKLNTTYPAGSRPTGVQNRMDQIAGATGTPTTPTTPSLIAQIDTELSDLNDKKAAANEAYTITKNSEDARVNTLKTEKVELDRIVETSKKTVEEYEADITGYETLELEKQRLEDRKTTLESKETAATITPAEQAELDAIRNTTLPTLKTQMAEYEKTRNVTKKKAAVAKLKAIIAKHEKTIEDIDKKLPKEKKEPEKTDKPEEKKEKKKEKKEGAKTKTEPTEKEIDHSKRAEIIGEIGFMVGLPLALAGALIPGFGLIILAIGAAMTIGGMALHHNAGKFKRKVYEYAFNAVDRQKQKEAEMFEELGKALELDKELDKLSEEEKPLIEAIENDTTLDVFKTIYDSHGVGFDYTYGDPTVSPHIRASDKMKHLLSTEGYEIRERMLNDLKQIHAETNPTTKNSLIDAFIDRYFRKEESKKLQTTDTERGNLSTFLNNTNNTEALINQFSALNEKQKQTIEAQKTMNSKILTSSDEEFALMIGSITKTSYEDFFKKYSVSIVKRFMLDGKLDMTKLDNFIASLPNEIRKDPSCVDKIFDIIDGAVDKIEKTTKGLKVLGNERRNPLYPDVDNDIVNSEEKAAYRTLGEGLAHDTVQTAREETYDSAFTHGETTAQIIANTTDGLGIANDAAYKVLSKKQRKKIVAKVDKLKLTPTQRNSVLYKLLAWESEIKRDATTGCEYDDHNARAELYDEMSDNKLSEFYKEKAIFVEETQREIKRIKLLKELLAKIDAITPFAAKQQAQEDLWKGDAATLATKTGMSQADIEEAMYEIALLYGKKDIKKIKITTVKYGSVDLKVKKFDFNKLNSRISERLKEIKAKNAEFKERQAVEEARTKTPMEKIEEADDGLNRFKLLFDREKIREITSRTTGIEIDEFGHETDMSKVHEDELESMN